MAAAGVQKEQAAQLEGMLQAAAAHGLEDGEHVKDGEESGLDMNLAVDGNVESGKEEGLVTATTPAAVTDIEKKRRRAERFGTDLKISEAEKRKLRAARFNDGTKNGSEVEVKTKVTNTAKSPSTEAKSALIATENAKRKARAERFGGIAQEVAVGPDNVAAKPKLSHDEEAKKKARVARFAMAAK